MTNNQKQVRDWMLAVGQECPEKPCIPSLEVRKLRAKLILEEALETCHALNMHPYLKRLHTEDEMLEDDSLGFWEDPKQEVILKDIADGCKDLEVVTEGTMVACGLVQHCDHEWEQDEADYICKKCHVDDMTAHNTDNQDLLFNEVMNSNNSKFWSVDEFTKALDDNHSNPDWNPHSVYANEAKTEIKYIVIKDRNGKVVKPPSYRPPNLQPIIDEMLK